MKTPSRDLACKIIKLKIFDNREYTDLKIGGVLSSKSNYLSILYNSKKNHFQSRFGIKIWVYWTNQIFHISFGQKFCSKDVNIVTYLINFFPSAIFHIMTFELRCESSIDYICIYMFGCYVREPFIYKWKVKFNLDISWFVSEW